MKRELIVLAALALCACSQVNTDLEKYSLNCVAKELTLQSDSLEFPYTASFNKRGRLDSVVTRNFDGSFRYLESFCYDSKGNLSEVRGQDADGEQDIRYEYEMDGKFVRECRVYGMNNQEIHHWIHTNDGKHIVRSEYFAEGEPQYITTKTFKGDSYVEESFSPEGELLGRAEVSYFRTDTKPARISGEGLDVEIEYNAAGLPVLSRNVVLNSLCGMEWVMDLDTHPVRYYSYEYDERGNWISRAERVHPDSSATAVLRRIIKY